MSEATREQVMDALFARLQDVPGITSASRRMTMPQDCAPLDLPRLMLWQQPEMARAKTALPSRRIWEVWVIIVTQNDDHSLAGASLINPMIEAIEAALAPDDGVGETCTLGGRVHYARIEGTLVVETGDTDPTGLGGAVIPVKIMPP